MQTLLYEGLKIFGEKISFIDDHLVIEAPLQININGNPYTVVMRTPNDDLQLIRGLLFAEDIYKKQHSLPYEIVAQHDDFSTVINITINKSDLGKGYLNKRTLLSVSSCGICGKKQLNDIKVGGAKKLRKQTCKADFLLEAFQQLKEKQKVFIKTGGSHAAAIFDIQHKMLTIKEDIGRHNAVDKCVGDLLEKQKLTDANYLLVSGRVSYEIVIKAFIAKIPVIVAVSACSSLAVDFAKEFGICLVGFTRNHKMTVYANASYLEKLNHG
ncbi:MAG: formate dehydrogenase accessory sulfurtransferase FdhD [Flavobacteriaceae bacterium]|nr:MAG: formate dehydrogenase accessory sulfurtransferase FdhD [Flavobacteriaceae bacterium]